MIGPTKTVVGARHIHEQVIDIRGPDAQRISSERPTCRNAQSRPPWLYQADRAGNLCNAGPCDNERGCQHPIRRNLEKWGWIEQVKRSCGKIKTSQKKARDEFLHSVTP